MTNRGVPLWARSNTLGAQRRASEVALYSSYQLPLPAAPAGTDKRARQITAIG